MGLFDSIENALDALSVAKDIVKGGIASYKADEKLDELAEKSWDEYEDEQSDEERELYKKYKRSKEKHENADAGTDEKNELLTKVEKRRVAYLKAVSENEEIPEDFREEVKAALKEYKRAESIALDSLEDTLMKHAETDEQREAVKKAVDDAR